MYAANLVDILNKYEQNFNQAYLTWYEENLDSFLEPKYEPSYILQGSPEIDWYRSEKMSPEVFMMRDGSVLWLHSTGRWAAYESTTQK